MTMLDFDKIMEIAKPFIRSVGDHWCSEEAIPEGDIEDFAKAIVCAVTKWIDIKIDGPPPNDGYYLVCMDTGLVTVTFFTHNHNYFDSYKDAIPSYLMDEYGEWSKHFEHSRVYGYRVTHWAKMPSPPKAR